MHEWALAEAVIVSGRKVAEEERLSKVTRIRVSLGELQQIDREIFEYALKEILKSQPPGLKDAQVEIMTEPALLRCRVCNHEWPFREAVTRLSDEERESIHFLPEVAHVYLRCPNCDSPDFEFKKGRGVWLESVEGE